MNIFCYVIISNCSVQFKYVFFFLNVFTVFNFVALSTAADSDKPLRCTLILSAWKLATDLLGKYPLLIEKVKYELRDMWRRLLEFLSLIKNVQASFVLTIFIIIIKTKIKIYSQDSVIY